MKDFIFIIGPSAVGKTTLAKQLYIHYNGVYIEQNMVPEFTIPNDVEDIGIYEEDLCFENTLMQINWFHEKGYKNIVALDFDDIRIRDFPNIFKGCNYIILRMISSNFEQIKNQMEERHSKGEGLYTPNSKGKSNEIIANRPLLPNEVIIDINGLSKEEVFQKAIELIDITESLLDYDYTPPSREHFRSWVKSKNSI